MAGVLRRSLSVFANRGLNRLSYTTRRSDSIFTKYREPPNGFLFNEKPLKPGEKRKWEWWEAISYTGVTVCALILILGSYYKPDKGYTAWARPEALRRIAEKEAAEAEAALAAANGESEEE